MNARNKLNFIYGLGAFAAAVFLGVVFGSWLIFLMAFSIMIAIAMCDGGIRPASNRRHRGNKKR